MASTVIGTLTVPWVPAPHRVDLLLADVLPDGPVVTGAFALVVDAADRTLLARVDRPGRGWDVPGGHLDDGEHPRSAAVRELAEEAGFAVEEGRLRLLGGLRITMLDTSPDDYPYPARAFMAFYTARLDHPGAPTRPQPGSECGAAAWFGRAEVAARCPGAVWLPLHASLAGGPERPWSP